MEKDYEVSPILPIGEKNYFCVEYPGYVKRTKRAIELLGGEKGLGEALTTDSNVNLKLRSDMFSHPIEGQIIPTSKLLVKVTRRVKKGEETWEKQVEGLVTKTLRFRGLSDFQYILPKEDHIYQLKDALTKGNVQHIMDYKVDTNDNMDDLRNVPPPIFTSIEGSLSYGYRQNAPVLRVRVRQPDGTFKIKLLNRSRTTNIAITSVRFHEENTPTKSWHNLTKPTKPEELECIEQVAKLFEERPIWSRSAVAELVTTKNKIVLRLGLVHNAYTFWDGPWRDCWVKYGIDPRSDQKYHIYQHIDIRKYSPSHNRVPLSENRTNISDESRAQYIFDGKMIPGALSTYLFYDIIDEDIRPLIDNPAYLKPKVTKNGGFYYICAINRIRTALREKFLSLIDTGKPKSLKNLDADLMDEIAKEIENSKENGSEGEDDEEVEVITSHENAVRDAMKESNKSDLNKRLKDVVDDYMEELVKEKPNADDDFDLEFDTLADYDEALDVFEEEENLTSDIIQDEDTIMKDT